MKKIFSLLLVLALAFSFAACSKESGTEKSQEETSPVTQAPAQETSEPQEAEEAQSQATMPPESETLQKLENAPAGENRFTFSGISLILPEGFAISNEADAVMAYAKEGSEGGDVINFICGEAVDSSIYSKELLDATFTESIPGYTGMKRYETGNAAGADRIIMGYDVERNDTAFHITQVILFYPDRSLALTFTDVSGKYAKDFQKSIESIKAE